MPEARDETRRDADVDDASHAEAGARRDRPVRRGIEQRREVVEARALRQEPERLGRERRAPQVGRVVGGLRERLARGVAGQFLERLGQTTLRLGVALRRDRRHERRDRVVTVEPGEEAGRGAAHGARRVLREELQEEGVERRAARHEIRGRLAGERLQTFEPHRRVRRAEFRDGVGVAVRRAGRETHREHEDNRPGTRSLHRSRSYQPSRDAPVPELFPGRVSPHLPPGFARERREPAEFDGIERRFADRLPGIEPFRPRIQGSSARRSASADLGRSRKMG